MSVVSGVILTTSLLDEALVARIDAWLESRGKGPLRQVDDHLGGSKHPQIAVFGGGYNFLDEDEFAAFVLSLPWGDPENVVLLINPEEGTTRVFRPTDAIRKEET